MDHTIKGSLKLDFRSPCHVQTISKCPFISIGKSDPEYLSPFQEMSNGVETERISQQFTPLDIPYVLMYVESEVIRMTTIKATEARANLYKLLDQAGESHEPIQITGKRSNAVLISEDDWRSIQETLYLLSIPGMRESIRKGLKTPVKRCSEKPGW